MLQKATNTHSVRRDGLKCDVNIEREDDDWICENRPLLFGDEVQDPKLRARRVDDDRQSEESKNNRRSRMGFRETQKIIPRWQRLRWQGGLKFSSLIQVQYDQMKRTVGGQ